MTVILSVLVPTPAHSGVGGPLSYLSEEALPKGTLVRVPLGHRELLGIVWDGETEAHAQAKTGLILRPISGVLHPLLALNPAWKSLIRFTARYYQRSEGEVALAALPPYLRELRPEQLTRRLKRKALAVHGKTAAADLAPSPGIAKHLPPALPKGLALTTEQEAVLQEIDLQKGPFLLFGSTGSGKTEVYMQAVQRLLQAQPTAQALVMVPEINLTPQLEQRFRERFEPWLGAGCVVAMHSAMTPAQRLNSWLAAHNGQARMVLGTRMAVLASMPHLRLIVVDEEHDPSYKQQEGARYSARDLAVYRGQLEGAKVLMGSATPSLESWHHSRAASQEKPAGRYVRLHMPSRMGLSALPLVRRVDMNRQPRRTVFAGVLLDAMRERIGLGQQILVLLNRRGYAPVLHCPSCHWKSQCPHCSAFQVFHKLDRTLRCHHCSHTTAVPRACPECGDTDVRAMGRGTEQLEELLALQLQGVRRPDGAAPRIARIDADSTRAKGALESQLALVHAGEIDVLVGTQMIAKGHDFRRVSLVAALDTDGALFSSDFRAPERLFSLLMQAAGRAGRDAQWSEQFGHPCEMWVQTHYPQHPLFEALKRHDYPSFAEKQLQEREQAGMPPYSFQALLRAEARTQEAAQLFLKAVSQAALELPGADRLSLYPPVPLGIQRVAQVERAQVLVESTSRAGLQQFLSGWQPLLRSARTQHRAVLRWAIDVDPLVI
ncbi:MAG: primosomal protein N' [Betaproteobacteria bacterium]|nr:primosomal protein N' [Betaproteobacteria bacterium]